MNELNALYHFLGEKLPGTVSLKLDAPDRSGQAGWLDIEHEGKWVVVEWKPGRGFGVSLLEGMEENPLQGLFEGPDRFFERRGEAQQYILSLLYADEVESPPRRAARV